jgi:hypothetical protein
MISRIACSSTEGPPLECLGHGAPLSDDPPHPPIRHRIVHPAARGRRPHHVCHRVPVKVRQRRAGARTHRPAPGRLRVVERPSSRSPLRSGVDGQVIERTTQVMGEAGLSWGHLTAPTQERAHQEHEVVQLVPVHGVRGDERVERQEVRQLGGGAVLDSAGEVASGVPPARCPGVGQPHQLRPSVGGRIRR